MFDTYLISHLVVKKHERHMVWVIYEDVRADCIGSVSCGKFTQGFLSCTRATAGPVEIQEVGVPIWGY